MRTSLIKSLAVVGCALVLAGVGLLAFGRTTVYAQDEQPTYVGAKECASCHRSLARDHAETNHALALQEVGRKQEEIIADFSTGDDVRMTQFPDEDAPRPFTADDVAYVVGSGLHVQRYLYEIDRNEYIVLPAEWNVADQKWQRLDLGADGRSTTTASPKTAPTATRPASSRIAGAGKTTACSVRTVTVPPASTSNWRKTPDATPVTKNWRQSARRSTAPPTPKSAGSVIAKA